MSTKTARGPVGSNRQGPRINEEISVQEMRLIGDDGTQYGVVSRSEALRIAYDAGLDLIEIAPGATPPVVKLMDFGKYKYIEQKKLADAKKKQVVVVIKEIKIRPNIEKHDLEVKVRQIEKFLEEGDKVRMLMQFKGREMAYAETGKQRFNEIINGILANSGAVIESEAKMMGNRVIVMLAPGKKK